MSARSSTSTATASPRWCSTTAIRAGEHIVGPVDYRGGKEAATGGHKGATRLGVENMARACVQGRAVMIDLLRPLRPRRARWSATKT